MKYLCVLVSVLIFSTSSFAQTNPVSWTTTAKKISANEYEITLTAKINSGWAIYAQNLDSDDGPVPTTIYWNDDVKRIGVTKEEGKVIKTFDKMFDMKISKYKKIVKFVQRVKASAGAKIAGSVEYMSCNDHSCLPPREVEFSVKLD